MSVCASSSSSNPPPQLHPHLPSIILLPPTPTCSCIPTNWPFYFGFLVPFILACLLNWIVYFLTLAILCTSKVTSKYPQKEAKSRVRIYVAVQAILSILFAVAWIFALVGGTRDVETLHEVGQYIFAVFIALHAVFTLILHTMRLKEAKEVWTHLWFLLSKGDLYAPSKTYATDEPEHYRDTELSSRSYEGGGVVLSEEDVPFSPATEPEPSTSGVVENKYASTPTAADTIANGEREKEDLGQLEEGEGTTTRL